MLFSELTHKWLHKRILEVLRENLGDKVFTQKILDVWCGNGNFLNELSKIWLKNLHGCDWFLENPELSKIAEFKLQNLNEPLLYGSDEFDLILFTEVVEHLENPNILLHEIHRILKKEWKLILSTPNIFTFISRLLFLFEWTFFQFRVNDAKAYDFPGHIAPFVPYMFSEVFKDKLKINKITYSNFIVPILGWEFPFKNRYFWNTLILIIEKI